MTSPSKTAPKASPVPPVSELDALSLPLHGWRLIEASAGTGKTWTLAALYVRLVLGHVAPNQPLTESLYPPQILVMTFTDAATAELRGRIRERLAVAARFFQTDDSAATNTDADDFLHQLRAGIKPEHWASCAQKLELAAQWMDEAAIFTIHGWSQRMLKSHAFDSQSLFTQTLLEGANKLQLQLSATQDYWRGWFYSASEQQLELLQKLAATPQELLSAMMEQWRQLDRAPAPNGNADELATPSQLFDEWENWQQQRIKLEQKARQNWVKSAASHIINQAKDSKILKGYAANHLPKWLKQMDDWAQGKDIKPDVLQRFTKEELSTTGAWDEAKKHTVFAHIQKLAQHLEQEPDIAGKLLAHAAQNVRQAFQTAKAQAGQFDFADLLQHLYYALQVPNSPLAQLIHNQYPVALIDEFQDTDPWQFGSLSQIYPRQPHGKAPDQTPFGLIMIGDPKQAIYSFRGADLPTYLQARSQVDGIYNLPGNYRSTAGVLAAVNEIFTQAKQPFGALPFVPARTCNPNIKPLQIGKKTQKALTVWHLPSSKSLNKSQVLQQMAALFASQMVDLLQSGAVCSADMAVLVRDKNEASAIRQELLQRGVRSVYLSERSSVYDSPQATDLWRILRAVANPSSARLLRQALASNLWSLSWYELQALLLDEAAWEAQVEQFFLWQTSWRSYGLLPMLYRLLHDQGLAARLLQNPNQGERALTNLLHLGELLQAASRQLQGEEALLRYLQAQLQNPQDDASPAQLRLESEANLVQVVTIHKAKGLEYPLVFLPFISLYKAEKKGSQRDDAKRLNEDVRLLYVALTRAKQALWLGAAQVNGDVDGKEPKIQSALSFLLARQQPDDLWDKLQKWAGNDIEIESAPQPSATIYQEPKTTTERKPASTAKRFGYSSWWSASFSSLTRNLAHDEITPAEPSQRQIALGEDDTDTNTKDDSAPSLPAQSISWNAFPAGSQYGSLLHDLLQWQAEHNWPASTAAKSPNQTELDTQWQTLLARESQRLRLDEAQRTMLECWVQQISSANLSLHPSQQAPSTLQLGQLTKPNLWPEMGFSLPVQCLASTQLDAIIQRHIWPGQSRTALQSHQLQGLLTGFMDLVLLHQGRYYVLDYKSNLLPGYAPQQLQQAMLEHRYDAQAALYLLALHRLLKSRLPNYDPNQHLGGALYWFVRGIDQPSCGLLQLSLTAAQIEELSQAFASHTELEALL